MITDENTEFEIGKAGIVREGSDVTVIANGAMVYEAVGAAEALSAEGISVRVIDMHTVKPLDEEAVIRAARETGAIVTAEEHQIEGGLGGAVAECLVKGCPVPMEMVAVNDSFGQSGEPQELMDRYGLNAENIAAKAKAVIVRK